MRATPQFVQYVGEWMARSRITQQELAMASKLSPASVSRLMQGKYRFITDDTVDELAATMGHTALELHHIAYGEAQSHDDPLADAFNFIRSRPETHDLLFALLKGVGWKGEIEKRKLQSFATKTR